MAEVGHFFYLECALGALEEELMSL
jgi:hypothetical protein